MGNNGYLKFILTALVLAIVFFGYMLVTAVDRVRERTCAFSPSSTNCRGGFRSPPRRRFRRRRPPFAANRLRTRSFSTRRHRPAAA